MPPQATVIQGVNTTPVTTLSPSPSATDGASTITTTLPSASAAASSAAAVNNANRTRLIAILIACIVVALIAVGAAVTYTLMRRRRLRAQKISAPFNGQMMAESRSPSPPIAPAPARRPASSIPRPPSLVRSRVTSPTLTNRSTESAMSTVMPAASRSATPASFASRSREPLLPPPPASSISRQPLLEAPEPAHAPPLTERVQAELARKPPTTVAPSSVSASQYAAAQDIDALAQDVLGRMGRDRPGLVRAGTSGRAVPASRPDSGVNGYSYF